MKNFLFSRREKWEDGIIRDGDDIYLDCRIVPLHVGMITNNATQL